MTAKHAKQDGVLVVEASTIWPLHHVAKIGWSYVGGINAHREGGYRIAWVRACGLNDVSRFVRPEDPTKTFDSVEAAAQDAERQWKALMEQGGSPA